MAQLSKPTSMARVSDYPEPYVNIICYKLISMLHKQNI